MQDGSSPRVRGRPGLLAVCWGSVRIIPAGAGQTRPSSIPTPSSSDHPRGCGADATIRPINKQGLGSSPRVRGRHLQRRIAGSSPRIIPAGAGQTSRGCVRRSMMPDHPRGCGADTLRAAGADMQEDHPRGCGADVTPPRARVMSAGSSPRVRGRHRRQQRGDRPSRIIPAGAGQTLKRRHCWPLWTDHPRGCGADASCDRPAVGSTGSSPRVRGRHPDARHDVLPFRIIPAGAGQTRTFGRCSEEVPDHPRGCGADYDLNPKVLRMHGSSPRVRGRPGLLAVCWGSVRIIPAGAGQTSSIAMTSLPVADHPRGCGADVAEVAGVGSGVGSSPRVRGRP